VATKRNNLLGSLTWLGLREEAAVVFRYRHYGHTRTIRMGVCTIYYTMVLVDTLVSDVC
jgi:hypothetical protein